MIPGALALFLERRWGEARYRGGKSKHEAAQTHGPTDAGYLRKPKRLITAR
jgi:hypothetical protein